MKVLKTANELRLEHMQMYFGKREEFKIELPLDSPIVHDVIEEINKNFPNQEFLQEFPFLKDFL